MNASPEPSDAAAPLSPYTQADAAGSLARAERLVLIFAAAGLPIALWRGGWRSAALLVVGAAISATGLREWRRLMAALMARMDYAEAVAADEAQRPSIGFAISGFIIRMLVVVAVLYVSLSYLHGSVLALAAGLAMGVVSLTVEGLRLLRSGTI